MNESTSPIKALGEVVLRVRNMNTMQEFYEKVVGLELLARYESVMAFFRIAPDYAGPLKLWLCSISLARLIIDRAIIVVWILRRVHCITWRLPSHYQIMKQKRNDCKISAWMWKLSNTPGSIIVRFISLTQRVTLWSLFVTMQACGRLLCY